MKLRYIKVKSIACDYKSTCDHNYKSNVSYVYITLMPPKTLRLKMGGKLQPTLLLCLCMSMFPHFQCEVSQTYKGFSLKLFQRNSFDNTSQLCSSHEDLNKKDDNFPDVIHPLITRRRFLFTIDVAIGTPSRKRSLIFDPGSPLTWTQCTPCTSCFKQNYPLFDPKISSSYKKLSPTHSLARFFMCNSSNGGCFFNTSYLSGQSVAGIASVETFTLPSNKNILESIRDVVFGCSNNHQGQFTSSTFVTGIMGMNRSV